MLTTYDESNIQAPNGRYLKIPCPTCKAKRHEWCYNPAGGVRFGPHFDRCVEAGRMHREGDLA